MFYLDCRFRDFLIFMARMNDFKNKIVVELPIDNIGDWLKTCTVEFAGHFLKSICATAIGEQYTSGSKETDMIINFAVGNVFNYPTNKKHYVYLFSLVGNGESFFKLGITHSIAQRKMNYELFGYSVFVHHELECANKKNALSIEKRILKENVDIKYIPSRLPSGFTECFYNEIATRNIFNYDN